VGVDASEAIALWIEETAEQQRHRSIRDEATRRADVAVPALNRNVVLAAVDQ